MDSRIKANASIVNDTHSTVVSGSPVVVPGLFYSRVVSTSITTEFKLKRSSGLFCADANLIPEAELLELTMEMVTSFRGCSYKFDQFSTIVRLATKFLHNNFG